MRKGHLNAAKVLHLWQLLIVLWMMKNSAELDFAEVVQTQCKQSIKTFPRSGGLLQLFIVDDGTALAYPKHYHGLYLAIESVKQVSFSNCALWLCMQSCTGCNSSPVSHHAKNSIVWLGTAG